jgi:hypothetical protein
MRLHAKNIKLKPVKTGRLALSDRPRCARNELGKGIADRHQFNIGCRRVPSSASTVGP